MCFKLWRKVKTLDKIESSPEKAGVSLCGLIAFAVTLTISIMYYLRWSEAKDLGEDYYCTDYRVLKEKSDDPYFVPENVGEGWTKAFLHNTILYGILSLCNLFAIVGGFKSVFRSWACCGHVLVSGYYIFAIIQATVVSFKSGGEYCAHAPFPGGLFTEHGAFLKQMLTWQWVLVCPLTFLATSGMKEIKRAVDDPRHEANIVPTEDQPSFTVRDDSKGKKEQDKSSEDSEDESSFESESDSDSYP